MTSAPEQPVPPSTAPATPILAMHGICKRFPGVLALDHVDLEIGRGEIHALVGQNGAGKSTLMKILAGDYAASSGNIAIDGRPVTIHSTRDAQRLGIGIVYQELSLLPNLSVAENIVLGDEPARAGRTDDQSLQPRALAALEAVGLEQVDPRTPVARLSLPERQLLEIARVLARRPRILILDEPTAALAHTEVDRLFAILRRLQGQDIGMIYITHRFKEVLTLCRRGTVLRNGRVAATFESRTCSLERLVELTLGQQPATFYRHETHGANTAAATVLTVRDLCVGDRVRNVSFELRRGETVGICGLLGAGQNEVARCLFGDQPGMRGVMTLHGKPALITAPHQAKQQGIAFLSDSRREEGLLPEMAVRENISIAALRNVTLSRLLPLLRGRAERAAAGAAARQTNVQAGSLGRPIRTLSGGNQQKALIARWLMRGAELFVFMEPTRGVDIGARTEIYRQLAGLAAQGKAVLLVSTDVSEVLALADRIFVMYAGALAAVLDGREATEEQVVLAMQGELRHAG